jgi:hypothetical protein
MRVLPMLLQALSEERATAVERLQLQLDLANEKVAVMTAEIAHLEQEGRQVGWHTCPAALTPA